MKTIDRNDPKNFQVYALCDACSDWTFIQGSWETYGQTTIDTTCEHCGSGRLNPQSVTSVGTFDKIRADKRSKRLKKEIERKKGRR